MKAINPKARRVYVPKSDRSLPPEQQTKIFLRPLTVAEHAYIGDTYEDLKTMKATRAFDLVRLAITGWENLPVQTDEGEVPAPFLLDGTGYASKETVSYLPVELALELVTDITEYENPTPAEVGKS